MRLLARIIGSGLVALALMLPGMASAAPAQVAPDINPTWRVSSTVTYADSYWNCVDPGCSSRVSAGAFQPNFQCAEFVSRSLAAAGMIPGLSTTSAQSAYQYYNYQGTTYNLLWVSSNEGGPLGLENFLKVTGWQNLGTSASRIRKGTVVFTVGDNGNFGHVTIGVGTNAVDAHNTAHYHVTGAAYYYIINAIYVHN